MILLSVTVPGDNSVDIYTHDLSLVVITNEQGELQGFNILAGGDEQGDGKLFFGLSIDNGRVKDEGKWKLKTALREIISEFQLPIRLTPNHNLIIYEIEPEAKAKLKRI